MGRPGGTVIAWEGVGTPIEDGTMVASKCNSCATANLSALVELARCMQLQHPGQTLDAVGHGTKIAGSTIFCIPMPLNWA